MTKNRTRTAEPSLAVSRARLLESRKAKQQEDKPVKRQERTAKATKRAGKKATEVIANAKKRVRKDIEDTSELAAKVKQLRDQGEAWWRIGHLLELPGSAATVAQGKKGAAQARKLYKQHFGALPERPKSNGNGKTRKEQRRERATSSPVLLADTPDEEIVSQIKGKTVYWSIDVAKLAGAEPGSGVIAEHEATVHPDYVRVEPGKNGERCVRFRELEPGHRSGPTRTVRLSAIHTIH